MAFHKYVFEKCQSSSSCQYKNVCICNDILSRFSYTTRQSSREFCEKLVEKSIVPTNGELSANVKNQSWFYSYWEKDPTVSGMLTMLDEIHKQMGKESEFKTFAERLTSGCNCPITFHFVDMGEHKLSDETYVKMNARGKNLTPFENFKASLEQHLETKDPVLYYRLKGKYDGGKYTGIDGIWLDLFWEIVNREKKEKELPDTAIMRFINRHFMNVWRCWYSQNSNYENDRTSLSEDDKIKYDDDKRFNERIIAEMPLYPTKDDFVSWDVYQYVLDKCGVEKCFVPVFNIWDKLCEENNCINNDCQAVWHRKKEYKWDLYTGDINNNGRETYPSRIAFYALLKYFEQESVVTQTSLAQWMRVIWNIIENSTIDSEETYHAALRLLDKLSIKCRNIYDALANHFEDFKLDVKYHAQDQVAEEIAKAKQILDENGNIRKYNGSCKKEDGSNYETWEDIIIDAERTAFFKGAIRFLYTDGDEFVDWIDFDVKWTNAKKYFDDNGVKDDDRKYKTDAILLKAVLFQVNDFWDYIYPQKFVFDNRPETWKSNILLEKGWELAVHQILMGNIDIVERNNDLLMYKDIYNTNLLNYIANKQEGSRIKWIHGHRAIYQPRYEGILIDDNCWQPEKPYYRNRVLSSLMSDDKIYSKQKIENCNFFLGWDINFKYNNKNFQWYRTDYIYLMEDDNPNKYVFRDKNKSEELEKYYCFNASDISSADELLKQLDSLIQTFINDTNATKSTNTANKKQEY